MTETPQPAADARLPSMDEIFTLIELGKIVAIVPASVAHRSPRAEIAYRPLTDQPPATLAVAWPQKSHSPAVAAFVRAAGAVAAADQRSRGANPDASSISGSGMASTSTLSVSGPLR